MNLRELIQQEAETGPADSRTLAAIVCARISPKDLRAALEQALPYMVKNVVSDRTQVPIVTEKAAQAFTPARKRAATAAWQQQLRDRYSIPTETGWVSKFLGDMTFDEVMAAAQVRFDDAARVRAAGEYLVTVADALKQTGALVVGDLSEPVLRNLAKVAA